MGNLLLIGATQSFQGPPIIVTQTEQTAQAPSGNDRTLDSALPSGYRMLRLGGRMRFGPPILLTQTEQTAFAPEGTDRLGCEVQPGATKPILAGGLRRQGPPILVRSQSAQTIFPPAGNDRYIDPPITHPLLKFKIGRRGPVLAQAAQVNPPPSGGGGPRQFLGFKVKKASGTIELCIVPASQVQPGMGGILKIKQAAQTYALVLVDITDPNASPVRIKTTTGIKAIRLKT